MMERTLKLPTAAPPLRYKAYSLHNFKKIPQLQQLPPRQLFEMEVVAHVFPFKANNYVVDELIDWTRVPDDPIYILTFPQKEMLQPAHFDKMARALQSGASKKQLKETANEIRWELNPHPAGQMEHNVPMVHEQRLTGMQHKYRETVLFFPSQGQTCHAYCTFCFRWPQFVGMDELKFAMRETELLAAYLREHTEVTDILFTGGDPLIMKTKTLATYLRALLAADLRNLKTIRLGTKALGYWPYRFLTDADAPELLALFREIAEAGKHLTIMAHFNHASELKTAAVQEAIAKIKACGAQIRTQSPLLAHINDDAATWTEMWKEQVRLGCVPYYMFVVRDTGAQHFFGVPLVRAWKIFRQAYQSVSGISRTVRGPSMSADPGKVQVLGVTEVAGRKVIALRFLQARQPNQVLRPFFAEYDEQAKWLDDLRPAFGERYFFFEEGATAGRSFNSRRRRSAGSLHRRLPDRLLQSHSNA